jgi:hypothetical protein
MSFMTLACQPEDLAMLQDVYKRILRESWFARSELTERDFAKAVICLFQQGIADEERLFVEALAIARSRFSRDHNTVETCRAPSI